MGLFRKVEKKVNEAEACDYEFEILLEGGEVIKELMLAHTFSETLGVKDNNPFSFFNVMAKATFFETRGVLYPISSIRKVTVVKVTKWLVKYEVIYVKFWLDSYPFITGYKLISEEKVVV
jgi:hypothetical protein